MAIFLQHDLFLFLRQHIRMEPFKNPERKKRIVAGRSSISVSEFDMKI